ncbi:MAG TPA: hypothetical protein VHN80_12560 [Kineosporiaceae bacterium]|nr:hypothetical protein [Kineosporiaceae bacterium]
MSTALPAALRARACGELPSEAAVELLLAARCWLRRDDFVAGFVHAWPGPLGGIDFAVIDWAAAICALRTGQLPSSGGEQRILRLSASLAEGIPVDLRDAITGLDETNLDLAVTALLHAGGRPSGKGKGMP